MLVNVLPLAGAARVTGSATGIDTGGRGERVATGFAELCWRKHLLWRLLVRPPVLVWYMVMGRRLAGTALGAIALAG